MNLRQVAYGSRITLAKKGKGSAHTHTPISVEQLQEASRSPPIDGGGSGIDSSPETGGGGMSNWARSLSQDLMNAIGRIPSGFRRCETFYRSRSSSREKRQGSTSSSNKNKSGISPEDGRGRADDEDENIL